MLAGANRLLDWDFRNWPVADDWRPTIERFLAGATADRLQHFIRARLTDGATIFPTRPFYDLALTPLASVKVVILGQDPYHGPGQAQGLAFSVAPGIPIPPSLRNIRAEIERDRAGDPAVAQSASDVELLRLPTAAPSGSLVRWARQGVLLLNTCLTVEQGLPASHAQQGWETLTDHLIVAVAQRGKPVVFMLWGAHAQSKQGLVVARQGQTPVLTLTASHPSPLSARRKPKPFIGCGHFSLANQFLRQHGLEPVKW